MITENSSVKIGVVISILGFVVGAIWWASAVQTKMDTLLTTVTECSTTIKASLVKTNDLDTGMKLLQYSHDGSNKEIENLKIRVTDLEKRKQP